MTIKNIGITEFNEKNICGIAVDIYSIMFTDKYDPKAIPAAWQKFWNEFPKELLPRNSKAYGVSFPIESEQGKLHYVAGVEVDKDFSVLAGFENCVIPAGKYLHLEHVGNIMNLAPSYAEAYGVEFPKTGLEMRPAPHLEIYDATLDPMSDEYKMGILIPVI